jgi:glutathione S-transferase
MKLFIGNKAYSSWSMRGWLAAKQSGLLFEEVTVPLYDEAWSQRREGAEFAPSSGKVPILWDGDAVVWDSLAIIDWLADKTERALFWPEDEASRAAARSMAAEMHSSFVALRRNCPMNVRRRFPPQAPNPEVMADVERIVTLWAQARARWGGGGDYLFGAWGAADIMFAPVVTRFVTYSLPVPRFAIAYGEAVLAHPDVAEWLHGAAEESWVIDRYEHPTPA